VQAPPLADMNLPARLDDDDHAAGDRVRQAEVERDELRAEFESL